MSLLSAVAWNAARTRGVLQCGLCSASQMIKSNAVPLLPLYVHRVP